MYLFFVFTKQAGLRDAYLATMKKKKSTVDSGIGNISIQ